MSRWLFQLSYGPKDSHSFYALCLTSFIVKKIDYPRSTGLLYISKNAFSFLLLVG